MKRKLGATALSTMLLISGCQQDGSTPLGGQKATIGTLLGGAAGGLAGSQFGSGSGKAVFTLAGVIAGGALGNYLGNKLDERDKQAASQAVNQALAQKSSKPVPWNNPDSGNSGTVYAKPIQYESRPAGGPTPKPVTLQPPPAQLAPAAPVYVAQSTVNLRAAPAASAGVVGKLRPERNFAVLGAVPPGDWLVVGQNGQAVGYVSAKVVSPAQSAPAPTPATPPSQQPTPQQPVPQQATAPAGSPSGSTGSPGGNSPSMYDTQSGGLVDPAAIDRSVGAGGEGGGTTQVACRTTVSTVSLKGAAPQTVESKFCQQSDGSWAPVSS